MHGWAGAEKGSNVVRCTKRTAEDRKAWIPALRKRDRQDTALADSDELDEQRPVGWRQPRSLAKRTLDYIALSTERLTCFLLCQVRRQSPGRRSPHGRVLGKLPARRPMSQPVKHEPLSPNRGLHVCRTQASRCHDR